jgi:hypothetical protein
MLGIKVFEAIDVLRARPLTEGREITAVGGKRMA